MAKVTSPPEEVERTVENSESPALLGGVQVLVDGGRLFFRRPGPDMNLLKGLWTLLPTSTRCRLWPASFAFGNHLQFDAVVLPRLEPSELEGYTSEEQAIDYPEGRYELSLQTAAETGDQQQLDQLLRRRSVWETWRLGLCLLALMIGLMLVSKFIPVASAVHQRRRQRDSEPWRRHPWSAPERIPGRRWRFSSWQNREDISSRRMTMTANESLYRGGRSAGPAVEVTLFGLGGEGVLRTYGRDAEAVRVIQRALDQGVNYFDTAPAYSGSRDYYGQALGERRAGDLPGLQDPRPHPRRLAVPAR